MQTQSDLVAVRAEQNNQGASLNTIQAGNASILQRLDKMGSMRDMVIAGASGFGGGAAAGVAYLLHYLASS